MGEVEPRCFGTWVFAALRACSSTLHSLAQRRFAATSACRLRTETDGEIDFFRTLCLFVDSLLLQDKWQPVKFAPICQTDRLPFFIQKRSGYIFRGVLVEQLRNLLDVSAMTASLVSRVSFSVNLSNVILLLAF
jgi:hypothetical protein